MQWSLFYDTLILTDRNGKPHISEMFGILALIIKTPLIDTFICIVLSGSDSDVHVPYQFIVYLHQTTSVVVPLQFLNRIPSDVEYHCVCENHCANFHCCLTQKLHTSLFPYLILNKCNNWQIRKENNLKPGKLLKSIQISKRLEHSWMPFRKNCVVNLISDL